MVLQKTHDILQNAPYRSRRIGFKDLVEVGGNAIINHGCIVDPEKQWQRPSAGRTRPAESGTGYRRLRRRIHRFLQGAHPGN